MADDSKIAKVVGLGAALGAAWVASKLIDGLWRAALGHNVPKPEDEGDDVRFAEVAAAAVISGAVVALFRVMATRGAAKLLH